MSYFLVVFLFITILFLILKRPFFSQFHIRPLFIVLVFSFKFLIASAYITYKNSHKENFSRTDYDNYLLDSKLLNSIFYENPLSYLKIVTGIGEESENNTLLREQSELWFSPTEYIVDYRTVSRTHSVIEFFAFGNEYIHLLFVAFIATFSLVLLVAAFQKWLSKPTLVFTVLGICFPSLLLFGGIISKDYILIFGMSCFMYGLSLKTYKTSYLWIGLAVLLLVKVYYLAILLVAILIYVLFKKSKKFWLNATAILFVFFGILFSPIGTKIVNKLSIIQLPTSVFKGFYLVPLNDQVRNSIYVFHLEDSVHFQRTGEKYKAISTVYNRKGIIESPYYVAPRKIQIGEEFMEDCISYKNANSYIVPTFINFSKSSFIKAIPSSILTTLTQPSFFSIKSLFDRVFAMESFVVFLFTIIALCYGIYNYKKLPSLHLLLFFITFIFLSALIIGITSPTVGGLVRYRIPTFIFLFILNFILIDSIWKKKLP